MEDLEEAIKECLEDKEDTRNEECSEDREEDIRNQERRKDKKEQKRNEEYSRDKEEDIRQEDEKKDDELQEREDPPVKVGECIMVLFEDGVYPAEVTQLNEEHLEVEVFGKTGKWKNEWC